MQESSGISSFEIKKYWGLVLRRKFLALSVALVVLTACTVFSFLGPKVYEAKCTVFVQRNTIMDPLVRGSSTSGVDAQLRTLTERINSESFLERVLVKLGTADNTKSKQQMEGLVRKLQANLTVTVKGGDRGADLFVITFKGEKPALVRDTVNTLVNQYIDENMESNRSDASGAIEFLQTQLAEYKSKLEATDKAIGSATVTSRGANTGASGATSQETRLSALNSRLATLLSQYTENHPEVLRTKSEIENLKKQPQSRGASVAGSSAARTPHSPSPDMTRLQRDRTSYQKAYDDLLLRLENAKLTRNLQLTDRAASLRVVDPAPLPTAPVKRNRVLIILAGFFLGAAAGVGVVLAIDYLNPSFKDEESVEAGLGLPILVSIPSVVTESDLIASRKFDKIALISAGAYVFIIFLLLIHEVLSSYIGIKIGEF